MVSRRFILGGIAALIIVGAAVAMYWPSNATPVLLPDDPSVVARGQQVYADQCASCHGEKLEGQENWRERRADGLLPAPPHDETGHTWHHPDVQLFDIVKRGTEAVVGQGYRSDMPGYEEILSDDDIIAVLSYIKNTWPKRIRDMHDRGNRR